MITLTIIISLVLISLLFIPLEAIQLNTQLDLWREFIGVMHPLFLHLPVGLLISLVVITVASKLTKIPAIPQLTYKACLILLSVSSLISVATGYLLYLGDSYPQDVVDAHLWTAVVFTLILSWHTTLYCLDKIKARANGSFLAVELCLLIMAGHYGGVITHGEPFDKAPWVVNAELKKIEQEKLEAQHSSTIYDSLVAPIMVEYCNYCHGIKKDKANLRTDSYAAMLEGGDEGPSLVPGNIEKSTLISRMLLPIDDEDEEHMPPANKKQLNQAELDFLIWWVKSGASNTSTLNEIPSQFDTLNQKIKEYQEDPKSNTNNTKYY